MSGERFAFLHHVTCKYAPLFFPCAGFGVVEHFALQRLYHLALAASCRLRKVNHIHPAVIVQAACQRFHRGKAYRCVYFLESHRLAHDVGFHHLATHLHFDGIHLKAQAVKRHHFFVAVRVEIAPLGHKRIVCLVQPFTEQGLFFPCFRFAFRQLEVSLSHRKIVLCPFHVRTIDSNRTEPCGHFRKTVGSSA